MQLGKLIAMEREVTLECCCNSPGRGVLVDVGSRRALQMMYLPRRF